MGTWVALAVWCLAIRCAQPSNLQRDRLPYSVEFDLLTGQVIEEKEVKFDDFPDDEAIEDNAIVNHEDHSRGGRSKRSVKIVNLEEYQNFKESEQVRVKEFVQKEIVHASRVRRSDSNEEDEEEEEEEDKNTKSDILSNRNNVTAKTESRDYAEKGDDDDDDEGVGDKMSEISGGMVKSSNTEVNSDIKKYEQKKQKIKKQEQISNGKAPDTSSASGSGSGSQPKQGSGAATPAAPTTAPTTAPAKAPAPAPAPAKAPAPAPAAAAGKASGQGKAPMMGGASGGIDLKTGGSGGSGAVKDRMEEVDEGSGDDEGGDTKNRIWMANRVGLEDRNEEGPLVNRAKLSNRMKPNDAGSKDDDDEEEEEGSAEAERVQLHPRRRRGFNKNDEDLKSDRVEDGLVQLAYGGGGYDYNLPEGQLQYGQDYNAEIQPENPQDYDQALDQYESIAEEASLMDRNDDGGAPIDYEGGAGVVDRDTDVDAKQDGDASGGGQDYQMEDEGAFDEEHLKMELASELEGLGLEPPGRRIRYHPGDPGNELLAQRQAQMAKQQQQQSKGKGKGKGKGHKMSTRESLLAKFKAQKKVKVTKDLSLGMSVAGVKNEHRQNRYLEKPLGIPKMTALQYAGDPMRPISEDEKKTTIDDDYPLGGPFAVVTVEVVADGSPKTTTTKIPNLLDRAMSNRKPVYVPHGDDSQYRPQPPKLAQAENETATLDLDLHKIEDRAALLDRAQNQGDAMAQCLAECTCIAPRWWDSRDLHVGRKVWNVETLPLLPDPIIVASKENKQTITHGTPKLCTMGKYVNGFNRFYTFKSPDVGYATAGLTLFCRFHVDFQLPEHDPNSQEIHLIHDSFERQAVKQELMLMKLDKNTMRGANCSQGNFIQGFKFRPANRAASRHGIWGLVDVHAKCTDGVSIMTGPRPLKGDPGDGSKWTRYVMCGPSFAVCGGVFKAVRKAPNQMISAQFYCCPLPVDEMIDWMGMPFQMPHPPPMQVPVLPTHPQKYAGHYLGLAEHP